jgi:C4-type Zn-finger protein
MTCPRCGKQMSAVEYSIDNPDHYDGVSEWRCDCGYREGRWTHRELQQGEVEPPFGEPHDGNSNHIYC